MKFRTVLGDIDEEKMGFTYTHEHVYCDPTAVLKDSDLAIKDVQKSSQELLIFKEHGGNTAIDGTAIDYGRGAKQLKEVSEKSRVNIIASTGYYLHNFNPEWISKSSIDEIASFFVKEINEGMDETDIKAGQIKCAVSPLNVYPNEEKCLRAAARAQKVTHAPIWIHHGGIVGNRILDILKEEGASFDSVILGHIDRNPDTYEIKQLVKRGCVLSVDSICRLYRGPLENNVSCIKQIIDLGCIDQLLISADFGRHSYFNSYGGGPGYKYIIREFIPRLKDELGLSEDDIKKIFVDNPRRIYSKF